jgi:hypothetical protein
VAMVGHKPPFDFEPAARYYYAFAPTRFTIYNSSVRKYYSLQVSLELSSLLNRSRQCQTYQSHSLSSQKNSF